MSPLSFLMIYKLLSHQLTFQQISNDTKMSSVYLQISVTVLALIVISHVLIVFIIIKASLKQHRYYLIQWLSFVDGVISLCAIVTLISTTKPHNKYIENINTVLTYSFGGFSLAIIIIISADRFCSVVFCLRYNALVTKKRIDALLVVVFTVNFIMVVSLLFYTKKRIGKWSPVTVAIECYVFSIRSIACCVIIVVNKTILKVRQEKLTRINKNNNEGPHSQAQEKITFLKLMERSIKDILVLNIWTVIFLLPQIPSSLTFFFSDDMVMKMRGLNFILFILCSLSNPIIYLTTQRELRKQVKMYFPCFKNEVDVSPATADNRLSSKSERTTENER